MGETVGDVLPFAIGIAVFPVPIIAVILMLFSRRARENGPAFLAGWLIGIAAVTIVALLISDGAGADTDAGANDAVNWVVLVLGLVLLFLAFLQWRSRPAPGEEASLPGWMNAIDSFTPVRAFGIGLLLSAGNPKNIVLAAGAGAIIGQAPIEGGETVVVVIIFVLLAGLGVAAPIAASLLGGERAVRMLDGWKAWLSHNNATIMTVILLVFGVVLFSRGLAGLYA